MKEKCNKSGLLDPTDKPISVDEIPENGKCFQELDEEIKKLGDPDLMSIFSFSFDL